MLHTVEIPVSADRIGIEMGQMRSWLDHMQYDAICFRLALGACRVDFESEAAAAEFATAFAGRVVPAFSID